MKKVICLLMGMVLVFLFSSCSRAAILGKSVDQDNSLANARIEQIYTAIKNQDKDAFKTIFSKTAQTEADNFDAGIDYLFSFIQGDLVSWNLDGFPGGEDLSDYGDITKQLWIWGYLVTNEQNYSVFLLDYPIDTINPDNAGLYMLI